MLLSDYLIWGLTLLTLGFLLWGFRYPHWREPWLKVLGSSISASATIILLFYTSIGLLDSIRFNNQTLLDRIVHPLGMENEVTYAAPFSKHLFVKSELLLANGERSQAYPPLQYAHGNTENILARISIGIVLGLFMGLVFAIFLIIIFSIIQRLTWQKAYQALIYGKTLIAWRSIWITITALFILICVCALLIKHYHIFGTDKIGRDVFYLSLKSIRTGLIIGTLTTLFSLPFALMLGAIAGYFRGWIDDMIQYVYTTLSSIPSVLLISAAVLMLQVYMAKHAAAYPTIAERADVRLLALCFILGITGWSSLCRFLRGETLKVRELEFVQAAKTLGVSPLRIILRHIIPNVFHIVIITVVLDFSVLVLAEAVLSYVGVGVDPTTISWGNMINSSRLELAREPVVWWPLLAALFSMFGLVFSANVFADALRDAFDPYLRAES
jgi:peptide/nickel transport system permease protein